LRADLVVLSRALDGGRRADRDLAKEMLTLWQDEPDLAGLREPAGLETEFWKAYRYVRRHRRLMDYQSYRRHGLPIGSGVTEAACKTVFTQRFKRSGMRWHGATGQVILDLPVIQLSGIWDATFAATLAARQTRALRTRELP
jgi:hypothetical protein